MGPIIGATSCLAAPPPPPGTLGRGTAAKLQNGSKVDENSDVGQTAKANNSGKSDLKIHSENRKPVKKQVNDKAVKGKGPEKVNLDTLFDPVAKAFKFYDGLGDNYNDIMSDMDTEGEENPNPKKRKSRPVLEPPSSEEDELAEDPY